MPDREKVIKRLEECLSASCRGFRTCPYSDDEWDAVKAALALLREQEPVKPKWTDFEDSFTGEKFKLYQCGNCGSYLLSDALYCSQCGKEVKYDA